MVGAIIEMITVGAKVFSEERKRYYENRTKELIETIMQVEDSTYYNKDMEAKGLAERQLLLDTESLRKEWIKDMAAL